MSISQIVVAVRVIGRFCPVPVTSRKTIAGSIIYRQEGMEHRRYKLKTYKRWSRICFPLWPCRERWPYSLLLWEEGRKHHPRKGYIWAENLEETF